MHETSPSSKKFISIFVLAMLNMAVMASLRNLPMTAEFGLSSLTFYLLVAILFMVPCALVSAELASTWPKQGGVYAWVKEAFGEGWGFFAIWMQWVHNVTWYPAMLSFVASTTAFILFPELSNNKWYILAVTLGGFWLITLLNFAGLKASAWLSTWGCVVGSIIPGFFLIGLGIAWYAGDYPTQIEFSWAGLWPNLDNYSELVFFAGMFLAFAGLEVAAVHVREVKDPQKNYPKSIFLAAGLALFIFVLGTLSIAMVVPKDKISLVSGLIETFSDMLDSFHLTWLVPWVGLSVVIGALAELNAWISGPVKGLHATGKNGNLPPALQKLNKKGVPANLLLLQAVIVSLASIVIIEMPSVSSAYWILTAMSAQLYLIMYILMFLAGIRLRYSQKDKERVYKVPGGSFGMWLFCGMGILSGAFAIVLGFTPPSQLDTGSRQFYDEFLFLGVLLMMAIPFVFQLLRKPHWQQED